MSGDGIDTTTTRLSQADQARAEAKRASARKNLAAMACTRYGIDPARDDNHWHRVSAAAQYFEQLADMLGLNEPPLRTACLRDGCDNEIPAWRRRDPGKAEQHGGQDYCSDRCRNMHSLRRRSDV